MRGDGSVLSGWTVVDREVNPAAHLQDTDSITGNRQWTVVDPNLVKESLAKKTDSRQVVRHLRGNIGGGRSTRSTMAHLNQIDAASVVLIAPGGTPSLLASLSPLRGVAWVLPRDGERSGGALSLGFPEFFGIFWDDTSISSASLEPFRPSGTYDL